MAKQLAKKKTRRKSGQGMECPACGGGVSRVTDNRYTHRSNQRRRRRECGACGHRWSTREVPADYLDELVRQADAHRMIQEGLRVGFTGD